MKTKKTGSEALVTVLLKAPHHHAGVWYTSGDRIQVSARQAQWLTDAGVVKPEQKPEPTTQ